jgi:hypothetical protein
MKFSKIVALVTLCSVVSLNASYANNTFVSHGSVSLAETPLGDTNAHSSKPVHAIVLGSAVQLDAKSAPSLAAILPQKQAPIEAEPYLASPVAASVLAQETEQTHPYFQATKGVVGKTVHGAYDAFLTVSGMGLGYVGGITLVAPLTRAAAAALYPLLFGTTPTGWVAFAAYSAAYTAFVETAGFHGAKVGALVGAYGGAKLGPVVGNVLASGIYSAGSTLANLAWQGVKGASNLAGQGLFALAQVAYTAYEQSTAVASKSVELEMKTLKVDRADEIAQAVARAKATGKLFSDEDHELPDTPLAVKAPSLGKKIVSAISSAAASVVSTASTVVQKAKGFFGSLASKVSSMIGGSSKASAIVSPLRM